MHLLMGLHSLFLKSFFGGSIYLTITYLQLSFDQTDLQALDTVSNCQRPVFFSGVSIHIA